MGLIVETRKILAERGCVEKRHLVEELVKRGYKESTVTKKLGTILRRIGAERRFRDGREVWCLPVVGEDLGEHLTELLRALRKDPLPEVLEVRCLQLPEGQNVVFVFLSEKAERRSA